MGEFMVARRIDTVDPGSHDRNGRPGRVERAFMRHGVDTLGKTADGRVFLYDPFVAIGQNSEHGHVAFMERDYEDFWAHLSNRAVELETGVGEVTFGYLIPAGSAFGVE